MSYAPSIAWVMHTASSLIRRPHDENTCMHGNKHCLYNIRIINHCSTPVIEDREEGYEGMGVLYLRVQL